MLAAIVLLFATAFPSTSRTSWMRPESFHLHVGMPRSEVAEQLKENGFTPQQGTRSEQMVVDFADDKALTLEFRKDRLHSIRFELFAFLKDIHGAFDEEKAHLRKTLGKPRKATSKSLIYDNMLPNVMVVLSDDAESENGKKGLGLLVVRYFDPAGK